MLENTSTYVPRTMSTRATALKLLDIFADISSTSPLKPIRALLTCMVLDKNILAGKVFEQKKKAQTALDKILISPTVKVLVYDFWPFLARCVKQF